MRNSADKRRRFAAGLSIAATTMLLIGFLAMSQEGPRKNPRPMSEESVAGGKEVFFEYCAGCHGRRADGRGLQALNLNPKPQNLRNAEFVNYLTDERMYGSISGGVRGTAMQSFELLLPEERRWDVINYIRSLTDGATRGIANSIEVQEVAPDTRSPIAENEESLEKGKHLYLNYCSSCHGARADGNGILSSNLIPAPRNLVVVISFGEKPFIDYLADARLYESITNGVPGTSMQPWIKVFKDEERWEIIQYLRAEAEKEREKGDNVVTGL